MIKRVILANTFSPKMVQSGGKFWVEPVSFGAIKQSLDYWVGTGCDVISIISHEITAGILQGLGISEAVYHRQNYVFELGDLICCFIPDFRGQETRELEMDEIRDKAFKYYLVSGEEVKDEPN